MMVALTQDQTATWYYPEIICLFASTAAYYAD